MLKNLVNAHSQEWGDQAPKARQRHMHPHVLAGVVVLGEIIMPEVPRQDAARVGDAGDDGHHNQQPRLMRGDGQQHDERR